MHLLVNLPVMTQGGLVHGEKSIAIDTSWAVEEPAETVWLTHPCGLRAMMGILIELDNKAWLHVSVSREHKIPSYQDLLFAKNTLIGAEKKAIQVFPPATEHVNIHPYCLHLWSCLERDSLPDFARENGMI